MGFASVSGPELVGIGSMVVDRVHATPRIAGRDEKVILGDVEGAGPVRTLVGGVLLNQLGWAAALGVRTGIFGRQGDDAGGRFLRAAMDRAGIARAIALVQEATSLAEIFVDATGERVIYVAPGATATTTAAHVHEQRAFLDGARIVSTEVSQLPLAAAQAAFDLAREAGAARALDLDVPPSAAIASGLGDERALRRLLESATLLKPSKSAAAELAPEAAGDVLALACALRKQLGIDAVVVTDGPAGCAVAAEEFEGAVPTQRVEALDTTGAGDAFFGGLLAGRQHGLGWEASARLGNATGAVCALQWGAFPEEATDARDRIEARYGESLPATAPAGGDVSPVGAEALAVLDVAIAELGALRARIGADPFDRAVALVSAAREAGCRVHVTGVGKPEHVAHYAASLLASTGTPATFLHATEAVHGSAGQLVAGDVVIAISNSGNTAELRAAVEAGRGMGARVIGVAGAADSWLAREADVWLDAGVSREGGGLGLAPRASVAAEILVLAALAAGLERAVGLDRAEYHRRHPAGNLGRLSKS
jgi:arabinose-5-phosphate isomerase